MRLLELIRGLEDIQPVSGLKDFQVGGVTCDSKKIKDNFIFVAIKGSSCDGHRFIPEAISAGAKAVVVENPEVEKRQGCVFLKTKDSRRCLAQLVAAFYGFPSRYLKLVGVTGTNGKTSITYILESILKEAGFNPGVIGTVNYRYNAQAIPSFNTTPGPEDLERLFYQMLKAGVSHVVMEVSSHALSQQRVSGISFSAGIFTNLTQDHLDYHKDLEDYFSCKARLFEMLDKDSYAFINIDDAFGRRLIHLTPAKVVTYGIENKADVLAVNITCDGKLSKFCLQHGKNKVLITSPLIGRHNVYNVLAAASFALKEGIGPAVIQAAIEKCTFIPGRLQRVDVEADFSVFVDYAHTEDALRNVILSLRQIYPKRIIVVFGCGGNRDKDKRPKMGKVVTELADFAFVTSDNPRSEDPREIINQILAGITKENYCVVVDRRQAIDKALQIAQTGDCVLVAGKGHESYQIIGAEVIPFDDCEVVKSCLQLKS